MRSKGKDTGKPTTTGSSQQAGVHLLGFIHTEQASGVKGRHPGSRRAEGQPPGQWRCTWASREWAAEQADMRAKEDRATKGPGVTDSEGSSVSGT